MAIYRLHGKEYKLRLDLDVLEQLEDKYGGVSAAFQSMSGGKGRIKTIREVFAMMANAAYEWDGSEERVTGNELKHADMKEFAELSKAIKEAALESSHAETIRGGEANNDTYDGFLAEIEEEEKKKHPALQE